jgi:mono/diheme cytochrome c family protein
MLFKNTSSFGLINLFFISILLIGAVYTMIKFDFNHDINIDPESYNPDIENGENLFNIGGCSSCHGSKDNGLLLSGGNELKTDFGTFYTPNISPDPEHGIGDWNNTAFLISLKYGVSPEGTHYYPSFPYASYNKMTEEDILDIFAYIKVLPYSQENNKEHNLSFPYNIREGVFFWKKLFLNEEWIMDDPDTKVLERGRYLVESIGHCGECHTKRGAFGQRLDSEYHLKGAKNPSGKGNIPSIHKDEFNWTSEDIEYYLTSGFTPDFDVVGGSMSKVVEGLAKVPQDDIKAIVKYLKQY